MTWESLARGQPVKAYLSGGWKKGTITNIYANSCTVEWSVGGNTKTTRIYDLRNIKPQ